jgi:thioredoxin
MVKELTDATFANETASGVVVVDCWAAWCGPCKKLSPIVDKVAEDYEGKAVFAKLDVDENPEVCEQQGIMSIPTLLFFKGGEMVNRLVGAVSKQEITAILDSLI